MKPALPLAFGVVVLAPVLLVYACSSDATTPGGGVPTATATTTTPSPTSTQTTPTPGGDSGPPDAANGSADSGCAFPAPVLDGGGLCGARAFGSPAAVLTLANAAYDVEGGTAVPPGVYEVSSGERTASVPYNWRETLVLDGTNYTQIRRFDTSNGSAGATNSRSGTYTVSGGEISFVAGCGKALDGGDISTGTNTFRYEVETKGCAVELRMIVAGSLLTFTRK